LRLPNPERAVIDIAKLRGYCLNPSHPRGRHKARVFATALGLTAEDAHRLALRFREGIRTFNAQAGECDAYGCRYSVDIDIIGRSGRASVRTLWIVRTGEDFPRLTSCYVL
jgi:hypothetical protein